MSSIVYLITVNGIPTYVGSAFSERYESRKSEHILNQTWLKIVPKSSINFISIDECENELRFELEHFYWDILISEGFVLKNKRDPIKTFPVSTKENALMAIETKRRNGTMSNGSKGNIGRKASKPNSNRGKPGSPNGGKALKGVPKSEEHKRKLSEAAKKRKSRRIN